MRTGPFLKTNSGKVGLLGIGAEDRTNETEGILQEYWVEIFLVGCVTFSSTVLTLSLSTSPSPRD